MNGGKKLLICDGIRIVGVQTSTSESFQSITYCCTFTPWWRIQPSEIRFVDGCLWMTVHIGCCFPMVVRIQWFVLQRGCKACVVCGGKQSISIRCCRQYCKASKKQRDMRPSNIRMHFPDVRCSWKCCNHSRKTSSLM
jgi:hypothetical protein